MSYRAVKRARRAGRKEPRHLTSRDLRHPVWCRPTTSDFHVFDQVFLEREFSALDDLTDVRWIIDGGANVGYASAWFLSRFPLARVAAVEPDPDGIADVMEVLGTDELSLVKLDIEGAEVPVLRGDVTSWLPRTRAVAGELHTDTHFGDGPAAFAAAIRPPAFRVTTSGEHTIARRA